MSQSNAHELSRLIARLSDGTLAPADVVRLNEMLRADPIAQEAYLDHLALDGWLECEFGGKIPEAALVARCGAAVSFSRGPSAPVRSWLQWLSPPVMTAIFIVFGFAMGATAWAMTTHFIARQSVVKLPVAQASFEVAARPLASGVPTNFGVWSGDFTELVGVQPDPAPKDGKQMLRFLRSDSAVEPSGVSTYVGDMFQVVDLRPWRDMIAAGTAVAELSASFAAARGEEMDFQTCLWAFAGDPARLPENWTKHLREELAYGSGTAHGRGAAPRWRRVTARMIVPPDAEFVVLELKVSPASRRAGAPIVFRGVYADEVELALHVGGANVTAEAGSQH